MKQVKIIPDSTYTLHTYILNLVHELIYGKYSYAELAQKQMSPENNTFDPLFNIDNNITHEIKIGVINDTFFPHNK